VKHAWYETETLVPAGGGAVCQVRRCLRRHCGETWWPWLHPEIFKYACQGFGLDLEKIKIIIGFPERTPRENDCP
jgi:hypothetical protein